MLSLYTLTILPDKQALSDLPKGKLLINTQYPDELVTYTLDGSEPTIASPRWTAPVSIKTQPQVIKAKAFYLGHESVTTYLFK